MVKKCTDCDGKGFIPRPSEYDKPLKCRRCRGTGDASTPPYHANAERKKRGLRQIMFWLGPEDMAILDAGKEVFGSYSACLRAMLEKFK